VRGLGWGLGSRPACRCGRTGSATQGLALTNPSTSPTPSSTGGPWGEHEIDWILMCKPPVLPRMALNPNEVEATRAFTQAELRTWMEERPQHGNAVSPWFGVMEKSLLYK